MLLDLPFAGLHAVDMELARVAKVADDSLDVIFPDQRHLEQRSEHHLEPHTPFVSEQSPKPLGCSGELYHTVLLEDSVPGGDLSSVEQLGLSGPPDPSLLFGRESNSLLFCHGLAFDTSKLTQALDMAGSVHQVEVGAIGRRFEDAC